MRKTINQNMPLVAGFLILTSGFFLMSLGGSLASSDYNETETSEKTALPIVKGVKPTMGSGILKISAPGRLRARESTEIVGEVTGKVIELADNFVPGGRLNKGDVLFRVNPIDTQVALQTSEANLSIASARLTQAELAHQRIVDLVEQGTVTQADKDNALADLNSAIASVKEAESQVLQASENLARTTVRAPFDALVTRESVSIDTFVTPGQVLGTLVDISQGELAATLLPKDIKALEEIMKTGEVIEAHVLPNEGSVSTASLKGTIDRFAPQVDSSSGTASVLGLFPDAFASRKEGTVFVDDFMTLEIVLNTPKNTWDLPLGTVRHDKFVWLIERGQLKKQSVEVLSRKDSSVLVSTSGDLSDKTIMLTRLNLEREGMRVVQTFEQDSTQ